MTINEPTNEALVQSILAGVKRIQEVTSYRGDESHTLQVELRDIDDAVQVVAERLAAATLLEAVNQMDLPHSELPPGETFTGTTADLQVGDYLMASVHGYSLVRKVNGSYLELVNGFSESGYPYGRSIHRPFSNSNQEDQS